MLAYLKRSGLSGSQLGQLTLGNPGLVCTLGKGRSLTVETADRVLRFMDEAPIGPMFRPIFHRRDGRGLPDGSSA